MDKQTTITLTIDDLERMMYRSAKGACDTLYKGLTKAYLNQFDEDMRTIIGALDEIKTNTAKKPRAKKAKSVE